MKIYKKNFNHATGFGKNIGKLSSEISDFLTHATNNVSLLSYRLFFIPVYNEKSLKLNYDGGSRAFFVNEDFQIRHIFLGNNFVSFFLDSHPLKCSSIEGVQNL